jgi:DNA-binding MarR family transcriptional regulator
MDDDARSDELRFVGQPAYGMVPWDAITDAGITPSAFRVLSYLYGRRNVATGHAWPGQAKIASELGVSMSTVERSIRALEARGWIKREAIAKVRPEWSGHPRQLIYWVHWTRAK